MQYHNLEEREVTAELFDHFERRQVVTKCKRKVEGKWVIVDDPFIDQWSEEEYKILIKCLKNTVITGGAVIGAFEDGVLKGFTSVEKELLGSKKDYIDLSCIHVSEDMRGRGIGRELFKRAADKAKELGGKKLYISTHSAVESQAFYEAMGCVEAKEYNKAHVEAEPCDCQLEYVL